MNTVDVITPPRPQYFDFEIEEYVRQLVALKVGEDRIKYVTLSKAPREYDFVVEVEGVDSHTRYDTSEFVTDELEKLGIHALVWIKEPQE